VAAYQDSNNDLRKAARAAGTPSGYKKEFSDANGSVQQVGYLTYKNISNAQTIATAKGSVLVSTSTTSATQSLIQPLRATIPTPSPT
jgi:hypothetical protein